MSKIFFGKLKLAISQQVRIPTKRQVHEQESQVQEEDRCSKTSREHLAGQEVVVKVMYVLKVEQLLQLRLKSRGRPVRNCLASQDILRTRIIRSCNPPKGLSKSTTTRTCRLTSNQSCPIPSSHNPFPSSTAGRKNANTHPL